MALGLDWGPLEVFTGASVYGLLDKWMQTWLPCFIPPVSMPLWCGFVALPIKMWGQFSHPLLAGL